MRAAINNTCSVLLLRPLRLDVSGGRANIISKNKQQCSAAAQTQPVRWLTLYTWKAPSINRRSIGMVLPLPKLPLFSYNRYNSSFAVCTSSISHHPHSVLDYVLDACKVGFHLIFYGAPPLEELYCCISYQSTSPKN